MEWFQIVMSVLLIAIPAFFAWIGKIRAKADKAELIETVDKRIEGEMKPFLKKQEEQDALNKAMSKQVDRIELRMDSILEALDKTPEQIEKGFVKVETHINRIEDINRENIREIWSGIAKKQDKKGG